jgi:hypothetical protein
MKLNSGPRLKFFLSRSCPDWNTRQTPFLNVFWDLTLVALVITDVSEEPFASIVWLKKIGSWEQHKRYLATEAHYEEPLSITPYIVPSSLILSSMMKVIRSSETSALTRATRRYTKEDGILSCHCRENIKSYIQLTGWNL